VIILLLQSAWRDQKFLKQLARSSPQPALRLRDRLPNGSVIKNPGPIARPANGAKTIMTCSPLAW
jgi:hypothetical protein